MDPEKFEIIGQGYSSRDAAMAFVAAMRESLGSFTNETKPGVGNVGVTITITLEVDNVVE